MAAPITPHPIPYRACERHPSGAFSPFALGSRLLSLTRQSANARLDVTDARIDHLPWMSDVVKPGVPRSTRKPSMPASPRAHITATSATPPLVIHVFSPLSTQASPSRLAVARIPAGFEPKSGS